MKTQTQLMLAAVCLLPAFSSWGQSAGSVVIVESAPSLETGLSSLENRINQLLETANKQLENAKSSLGDPDAPPSAEMQSAMDSAAQSLGKPVVELDTNAKRTEDFTNLTGETAFGANAFGTLNAIGETVTRRDGTVVNRDPARYRMDAAQLKQINDYNTARDNALARKKELQEAIQLLTEQMNETKDLVSISKLSTMINALNGQVQDCNQIILISEADSQMLDKEMLATSRVVTKGERERREQFNKRPAAGTAPANTTPTPVVFGNPNAPGGLTGVAPGSTTNTTSSFAPNLRWGTYNTKPPAAGSTGGASGTGGTPENP